MNIKIALAAAALAACLPLQGQTQDLPRAEIEEIVREYLMREPEVIYEAIQEFQRRQQDAEAAQQREMLVSRADDIFGDQRDPVVNEDGDVIIVEFFDYRCGYCRSMTPGLQALLSEDPDLKFVFKEFPILGEDSTRAARAALAAKMQDGYEVMHFGMMQARDLSLDGIRQLASDHGLDADRLVADMESEEVSRHLDDNIELARSLGINGTPSFVFDDTLIPGALPIEQLQEMVEERRGG